MTGWPWIVAVALGAHGAVSMGQTPVYESKDKAGPVYSDKPSPGAQAVDLAAPNVLELSKVAPPAPPPTVAALTPYRSLSIVSLTSETTVHTNTGAFEFSVRAVPALRPGDRIRIRLDGRQLPSSFRSTQLRVGESDWKGAASADNPTHTVQVAIVDTQGTVLIESAPVRFYVQRATAAKQRR